MTVAYPSTLPIVLRSSKSRSQGAPFSATPASTGKFYVQATGFDIPMLWSVQFRFSPSQAQTFKSWFETDIQRGLLEFTLPIRTEFGLITHTCRFMPDGLLDCTEDGQSWTYSAKIMAREQVIPNGYVDAADLIVALPNWDMWMEALDIGISRWSV